MAETDTKEYISTLDEEVATATSVNQIRADSSILGSMNKILGMLLS